MTGMKRLLIALAASSSLATAAEAATELRMMWYSDGNEGEVMQDLLTRFEKENPDIHVVLDNVAYDVIQTTLPVQLESDNGPDMARVTNIKAQAQHWLDLRPHLKDPAYWETNFADYLDWMRPDGSNALPGFMTQLTVTGPYINKTLFDQAGVEVLADGATWDEWVEAAKKVAASQGVPIALGWDRSGHRLAGPAISMGAKYIGEDGMPAVIDDGFKAMTGRIAKWHEEGTMPKEIWGGVAGQTYAALNEEFANGNVVMYEFGLLADRPVLQDDRRRLRLVGDPAALRAGGLLRPAGRRGSGGDQRHRAPRRGREGHGMAGERADHEGVRRAHPLHPRQQGRRREGPRLQDRQCERKARPRRLRRRDREIRAGRQAHAFATSGRTRSMPPRSPAWARSSPARSRSTTPMPASPTTSRRRSQKQPSDRLNGGGTGPARVGR